MYSLIVFSISGTHANHRYTKRKRRDRHGGFEPFDDRVDISGESCQILMPESVDDIISSSQVQNLTKDWDNPSKLRGGPKHVPRAFFLFSMFIRGGNRIRSTIWGEMDKTEKEMWKQAFMLLNGRRKELAELRSMRGSTCQYLESINRSPSSSGGKDSRGSLLHMTLPSSYPSSPFVYEVFTKLEDNSSPLELVDEASIDQSIMVNNTSNDYAVTLDYGDHRTGSDPSPMPFNDLSILTQYQPTCQWLPSPLYANPSTMLPTRIEETSFGHIEDLDAVDHLPVPFLAPASLPSASASLLMSLISYSKQSKNTTTKTRL